MPANIEEIGVVQPFPLSQRIFLYLPIYMAIDRINRKYKKSHHFKVKPAQSDKDALRQLLESTTGEQQENYFAVCDPLALLEIPNWREEIPNIRLLGGLIQTATFWIVDGPQKSMSSEDDLDKFQMIFTYSKETTAHWLAKRAVKTEPEKKIRECEYGNELYDMRREKDGTAAAITADVATLGRLLAEESVGVCYKYFDWSDFSNALTTGLLVRTDILERKKDLVKDFLREVQRSLDLVRMHRPEAVDFATKYFSKEAGLDSRHALRREVIEKNILPRIRKDHLYPMSLCINLNSWQDALRNFEQVKGLKIPDDQARQTFNQLYYREMITEICEERIAEDLGPEGSRWDTFIPRKLFPWLFGSSFLSQLSTIGLLVLALTGFLLRDVEIPRLAGKTESIGLAALVFFVFCAGMNLMNALGIKLDWQKKLSWQTAEYLAPATATVGLMMFLKVFEQLSFEQLMAAIVGAGKVIDSVRNLFKDRWV